MPPLHFPARLSAPPHTTEQVRSLVNAVKAGRAAPADVVKAQQAVDRMQPQARQEWQAFLKHALGPALFAQLAAGKAGPGPINPARLKQLAGQMALAGKLSGGRVALLGILGQGATPAAVKLLASMAPGQRLPCALSPSVKDIRGNWGTYLFGAKLGEGLVKQGIKTAGQLLSRTATPTGRSQLAQATGAPRWQVLGAAKSAELLGIGSGAGGEQALSPEYLEFLAQAGVHSRRRLAEFAQASRMMGAQWLFDRMRQILRKHGHDKKSRPLERRDVKHWAQSAASLPDAVHLPDPNDGKNKREDRMELVLAALLDEGEPGLIEDVIDAPDRPPEEVCYYILRSGPPRPDGKPDRVYMCVNTRTGAVTRYDVER